MGRPRKRRREDQPAPDDVRDDSSTSNSNSNSNSFPAFSATPDFLTNRLQLNPFDPAVTIHGPGYTYTNDRHFHDNSNLLVDPYLQDALSGGVSMPAQSVSTDLSSEQQIQFSPPEGDGSMLPCNCLSGMYLTLSGLQALQDFGFPMVLPIIRSACSTAYSVLTCEQCPRERGSAASNLMLLTTLLTSIVDRYDHVMKGIDTQAEHARETGESIPFRMGENRPETAHMHTGTLDCPMGFDIDLSAAEWQKLARKVIKADIIGPAPHGRLSVLDMVNLFEERQRQWHLRPDIEHLRAHYEKVTGSTTGEYNCLKFIDMIRQHIEAFDLRQDGEV